MARSREIDCFHAFLLCPPAPRARFHTHFESIAPAESQIGRQDGDLMSSLRKSAGERTHLEDRAAAILEREIGLNCFQDAHDLRASLLGNCAPGLVAGWAATPHLRETVQDTTRICRNPAKRLRESSSDSQVLTVNMRRWRCLLALAWAMARACTYRAAHSQAQAPAC